MISLSSKLTKTRTKTNPQTDKRFILFGAHLNFAVRPANMWSLFSSSNIFKKFPDLKIITIDYIIYVYIL